MKALVLAGGFPQIALLEDLKARGVATVLADWNSDPVAKRYADKFYQASTLDEQKIEEIAIAEKVDFVITVCTDQALLTVAKVSERLGLPCYINSQTALNVTNKTYMKDVFVKNGIPTAKFLILQEISEEAVKDLNYPIIVKPADCNSSKGVRRVENYTELKKAFDEASMISRTNSVIIEEFITGSELSADFYISNGEAILLSVSESRKIADHNKFVIFRAIYPPASSFGLLEKIKSIGQKIANAFNITDAPMLVQLLANEKNVNVIEFSARTGGGVKYLLIKHISGFDVIKSVVDLTMGIKPVCNVGSAKTKYLVNDFIYCKPGVYDHLVNFEELKHSGDMTDYYVFKWKGASFDSISNSGDRVAGYTVTADSLDELIRKHNAIRTLIRVEDVNGNDIMRHDLLTDLDREDFQ